MKFAPTCAFSVVVACLLAQGRGAYGSSSLRTSDNNKEERKLEHHGGGKAPPPQQQQQRQQSSDPYYQEPYVEPYVEPYYQEPYYDPYAAYPADPYPVKPRATLNPTPRPTPRPTPNPTSRPTPMPTPVPTHRPTVRPTPDPTPVPTRKPTRDPTRHPTRPPTRFPTPHPTEFPSANPTDQPSANPTRTPSVSPSASPTQNPSPEPSAAPSPEPSVEPTQSQEPTRAEPSNEPSDNPTASEEPSQNPTASEEPSQNPTASEEPSEFPTQSEEPSEFPTQSEEPSENPTQSEEPTEAPTGILTLAEIICHVSNRRIYGTFCAIIRETGLDVILNNYEELDFRRRGVGIVGRVEDGAEAVAESEDEVVEDSDNNRRAMLSKFDHGEGFTQNKRDNAIRFLENIPNIINNDINDFNYNSFNVQNNPFNDFSDIIELFTVFAPTNQAFEQLNFDVLAYLKFDYYTQVNYLLDIAEYSIIAGRALVYDELACGRNYRMSNGVNSRTECRSGNQKFQVGRGNRENHYTCVYYTDINGEPCKGPKDCIGINFNNEDDVASARRPCNANYPEIIQPRNIFASNGVLHTVDDLLLPFTFSGPRDPTRQPSRRPTPSPSTDCEGANGSYNKPGC